MAMPKRNAKCQVQTHALQQAQRTTCQCPTNQRSGARKAQLPAIPVRTDYARHVRLVMPRGTIPSGWPYRCPSR